METISIFMSCELQPTVAPKTNEAKQQDHLSSISTGSNWESKGCEAREAGDAQQWVKHHEPRCSWRNSHTKATRTTNILRLGYISLYKNRPKSNIYDLKNASSVCTDTSASTLAHDSAKAPSSSTARRRSIDASESERSDGGRHPAAPTP